MAVTMTCLYTTAQRELSESLKKMHYEATSKMFVDAYVIQEEQYSKFSIIPFA